MMTKIVEQTTMSRNKAKKKQAKAIYVDKRGRHLNRIFSLLLFFQSNLSLVGTEASPFGGALSLHMPTYLTDVDPPGNDAYLRCGPTV